jgi:hypothetical protein
MIRRTLLAVSLVLTAASLRAANPVVAFSQASYTFHETDGTGIVTVNRSGDLTGSFSVSYNAFITGVSSTGTVSFGPNETSKTISLTIPNDNQFDSLVGASQGYFIALISKVGVTFGSPSNANIQVIEDESPPTVSMTSVSVPEGDSGTTNAVMIVTLSGTYKRSESFFFSLSGTATSGIDYQFPAQSVLVQPGVISFGVVIKIIGDRTAEPDETIILNASIRNATTLASVTILNDDYILTPATQIIPRGTVGTLTLSTSVPSPTTDHVLLSSSEPGVATVPPFVDIPAGSMGMSIEVTTLIAGSTTITAALPLSRGGGILKVSLDVLVNSFFTFDKSPVSVLLSKTITISAHLSPPPDVPVVLFLTQSFPSIAQVPSFFTIGTNGMGTFDVRGTAVGVTLVTTTVPPGYGAATTGFRIDVLPSAGVALTRIDQTSGPSTGGQRVSIFAAGMNTRCTAMFDGVSGLNTSVSASGFLTTTTPPHDAGAVDVSVRCGAETGTLSKAYTYTSLPATLTRISPASGPAGGEVLVGVTGANLRRGRCSLSFGGAPATTLQNNETTSMLVAAPPHAAGSVDVTLRCGSDISTLTGGYLYTSGELLAQVAGVTPPSGAPGDRVFVTGSAFRDDDAIYFGNAAGLDMTSASDQHFVTVPDLPPGNVTVTLHDAAGHVAAGPSFRVLSPVTPQIASAPAQVLTSAEFPITGSGLRRSLNFLLGGRALQPVAMASTFGQLRLPDSIAPGTYSLTIANQNVTPCTIQVTDGIAVSSVSIPCASTEGGLMVTISGKGFASGAVVAFGASDSADVTVLDAHTILARVPPSSGVANETIIVTNPTGESAQLSNAFRYRWPDPGCGTLRRRGANH